MILSLSPGSLPEGMPWIGRINATRGARGSEQRGLGVGPGSRCGDSSQSKVGKAADGDLPLYAITADILNWFSGTRGIEEEEEEKKKGQI